MTTYVQRNPLLVLLLALFACPLTAQPTFPGESAEQRDARMQWWRDAKYGMFIHWGASAVLRGEWNGQPRGDGYNILRSAKMPIADYAEALSHFNPVDYDAEQWVLLAKDAGMKYIVFIAKHHDGFALWDTQVSTFDIIDHTPFKCDILAELAEACARHDMKLGVYYSHSRDWYHPGGAIAGNVEPWDPAQKGDFDTYLRTVAEPQVRELLTNYGPIAVMWWDMPEQITPEQADRLNQLMALQPGIIANNRLIWGNGDFDTPERYIPAFRDPPDRDIEACMTIGRYWIYSQHDYGWKSASQLLQTLLDAVSKGGNLLLNVSPDERGNMIKENVEPLRQIGVWLRKHGESVYGTQQGPFRYWQAGTATVRGDVLYLHVYHWPSDGALVVPISNTPSSVSPLGDPGKQLAFRVTSEGVLIDVPGEPLDPLVSVLAMKLSEPAVAIRQGHLPDAAGVYDLTPDNGERQGAWIDIDNNAIVRWTNTNPHYRITWPVYIEKPAAYRVETIYSCIAEHAGGDYQVKFDTRALKATLQPTQSLDTYETFVIGSMQFDEAGTVEVELRLPNIMKAGNVRFHGVRLVPE